MLTVHLNLPSLGSARFLLDRLDGNAELLAEPGDPLAPASLLARLLRDPAGGVPDMANLLVTWRDRLLAALFTREFGNLVQSRGECGECEADYEFGFSLSDIVQRQDAAAQESGLEPDVEGRWKIANGSKLRPPNLANLSANPRPNDLASALIEDGEPAAEEVERLLEAGAPLLSFDLETKCPECGASQSASFEIGRYLVESIASERPFLIRETHLLASRYGWDHSTIMALPRKDRQAYAALIESERSAALQRRGA